MKKSTDYSKDYRKSTDYRKEEEQIIGNLY